MPSKTVERIVAAAAVLVILAVAWIFLRGTGEGGLGPLGQGRYALATTDGTAFTEDSLKGHPSAVFFGFTHCPDVCPTTLGDIATWQEQLGEAATAMRFWFVTVDPERNSLEQLRDYLSWSEGVVGVSGPRTEIDKAIAAFRVYARKVPLSDGGYTMDHTPFVMLFGRDGQFVQTISYREDTTSAIGKLRALIGAG